MPIDYAAVEQTLASARDRLLAARVPGAESKGVPACWEGQLSSSALSTATAVCALELLARADRTGEAAAKAELPGLVRAGLAWIDHHQNEDGGWGDSVDSPSNVSTTALSWAALGVNRELAKAHRRATQRAEAWLIRKAGGVGGPCLARAISEVYGRDRTFAVPILTMCALSGRFGTGRRAWRSIRSLPFELAACPHRWLSRLRLGVVSYALPALIAVGQVVHHHRPTLNPVTRCLRRLVREKTLKVLQSIQPASGGFLEAAPLTGFVLMSLVSIGRADHPVARKAAAFLAATARSDGSWPIDTNLATWVTTLSVNALASGPGGMDWLSADERAALRTWLLDQQYRAEHSYTHAAPGGWAWTDLSGGVPDADDTAGALLALRHLSIGNEGGRLIDEDVRGSVANGVRWLLDLQNSDGGIPTFCQGWGRLPFDRSSPDLTAHALRAWNVWRDQLADDLPLRVDRAMDEAIRYLVNQQRNDGAWVPLWFGNQEEPDHQNPLYGTARVLRAGQVMPADEPLARAWRQARRRGLRWVLLAQNKDGGWGGGPGISPSIEETALAVEALAGAAGECQNTGEISNSGAGPDPAHASEDLAQHVAGALERGCAWLVEHTAGGTSFEPAPIGLYFAKLWYFERLYPLIFTVAALERVVASRAAHQGQPGQLRARGGRQTRGGHVAL